MLKVRPLQLIPLKFMQNKLKVRGCEIELRHIQITASKFLIQIIRYLLSNYQQQPDSIYIDKFMEKSNIFFWKMAACCCIATFFNTLESSRALEQTSTNRLHNTLKLKNLENKSSIKNFFYYSPATSKIIKRNFSLWCNKLMSWEKSTLLR